MLMQTRLASLLFLTIAAQAQVETEQNTKPLSAEKRKFLNQAIEDIRTKRAGKSAEETLQTSGDAILPAVISLIQDPDPTVRKVGYRILAGLGKKADKATAILQARVKKTQGTERMQAAHALFLVDSESRFTIPILAKSKNVRHLHDLINVIGLRKEEAGIPILIDLLHHSTSSVPRSVVLVLRDFNKAAEAALPQVLIMLRSLPVRVSSDDTKFERNRDREVNDVFGMMRRSIATRAPLLLREYEETTARIKPHILYYLGRINTLETKSGTVWKLLRRELSAADHWLQSAAAEASLSLLKRQNDAETALEIAEAILISSDAELKRVASALSSSPCLEEVFDVFAKATETRRVLLLSAAHHVWRYGRRDTRDETERNAEQSYRQAVEEAIRGSIGDTSTEVREAACRLLYYLPEVINLMQYRQLLSDSSDKCRQLALKGLGRRPVPDASLPLGPTESRDAEIAIAKALVSSLQDKSRAIRINALYSLRICTRFRESTRAELLKNVIALQGSEDKKERKMALAAEIEWTEGKAQRTLLEQYINLGGAARSEALTAISRDKPLTNHFLQTSPEQIRIEIYRWLYERDRCIDSSHLIPLLRDKSTALRVVATQLIGNDPSAQLPANVLQANLIHATPELRRVTAELIGKHSKSAQALAALLAARLVDPVMQVRSAAAYAIEAMGDSAEPLVPQLVLALDSSPGLVQRGILRVLLKLGAKTDVDLRFGRAQFQAIAEHGPRMARKSARQLILLIENR